MLNNYTRTAWRNLSKNRVFTLINILGLSAGIAAFLFITTYVQFQRSYERFMPKADNIWRITLDLYNGSEYVVTDCETHAPVAGLLKNKYSEVVDYVRMFNNDGLRQVEIGDKKFVESGMYFADPTVFDILAVDLVKGDAAKALNEPFQVVMSESQAKKLFGNSEVVGESLMIDQRLYHVTGVFTDRHPNTHLKFEILLSHSSLKSIRTNYTDENWNGNNEYTYLLMKPGADLADFNQKLAAFSEEHKKDMPNSRYVAETMTSIHLNSNKTFEPEANGSAKVVSFLSIIAVIIIVIAWVNYMNLATARAAERAREVGIRKVMGSVKSQLVFQFLAESFIVNFIAASIALVLVQGAMPLFRELAGLPRIGTPPGFWMLLIGLATVGALLAGIYPAFVLSSFKPVAVLKGKFQSSSHGQILRKGLVVLQFATTIIIVIGVCTVYLQVNHLRSMDLGTNIDQSIAVRMPRDIPDSLMETQFSSLKVEAMTTAGVTSVSNSNGLPGTPISELNTSRWSIVGRENESGAYTYYWYYIDENFVKTLGMKMAAGRNFEKEDEAGNVLINETAARSLGFQKPEDALGAQMTFYDFRTNKPMNIIGVIKDFHQRSPKEEQLPMVFPHYKYGWFFIARFTTDDPQNSLAKIRTSWEKVFPNDPFIYFFVDEKFEQQYRTDVQFGQVMGTFSVLAVVIACLGLFGLSSYTILQRRKEIGIRKVLGATVGQVVQLLSGSYVKIVLLAMVFALPIAWFAVDNWLSAYTVRINLSAWMFVIPALVILLVALITVSLQTMRGALVNPAISLKDE